MNKKKSNVNDRIMIPKTTLSPVYKINTIL